MGRGHRSASSRRLLWPVEPASLSGALASPPDASAPGKERRPRGGGLEDSAARPAGRPPALRSNRLQDSSLTQRRGFFPRPCRLPGTLGKLTK